MRWISVGLWKECHWGLNWLPPGLPYYQPRKSLKRSKKAWTSSSHRHVMWLKNIVAHAQHLIAPGYYLMKDNGMHSASFLYSKQDLIGPQPSELPVSAYPSYLACWIVLCWGGIMQAVIICMGCSGNMVWKC